MECSTCLKKKEDTSDQKLLRCGKCMVAAYCSATCQREAWPTHKTTCKRFVPPPTITSAPLVTPSQAYPDVELIPTPTIHPEGPAFLQWLNLHREAISQVMSAVCISPTREPLNYAVTLFFQHEPASPSFQARFQVVKVVGAAPVEKVFKELDEPTAYDKSRVDHPEDINRFISQLFVRDRRVARQSCVQQIRFICAAFEAERDTSVAFATFVLEMSRPSKSALSKENNTLNWGQTLAWVLNSVNGQPGELPIETKARRRAVLDRIVETLKQDTKWYARSKSTLGPASSSNPTTLTSDSNSLSFVNKEVVDMKTLDFLVGPVYGESKSAYLYALGGLHY